MSAECRLCGREMPVDAVYCPYCGKRIAPLAKSAKKRGNGQGTVYKRGDKYVAEKTLGYFVDESGRKHRKSVKKTFDRKKDAVASLSALESATAQKKSVAFRTVYEKWFDTLTVDKSTQNCYSAAFKYFEALHFVPAPDIDIDDLQECIFSCPCGKRTRQNMKTVIGLIYKYGIPRGYFPEKLNLSDYISIRGDDGAGGVGLPDQYVETIKNSIGTVYGAELVYAHCYLGFRPAEFLALKHPNYDPVQKSFVGGAKTDAGKNRIVTVSPKIQSIVDEYSGKNSEQFFCAPDGSVMDIKSYRDLFYSVLASNRLDNPIFEIAGKKRHTYTPHSCRHTFATLMKRVSGVAEDKLKLIGHTSEEMLRYYQDAPVEDLRKITDLM